MVESTASPYPIPRRLAWCVLLAWLLIVLSIASYFILLDVPWVRATAAQVWIALAIAVALAVYCWPRDRRKRTRIGSGGIVAFAAFAVWAFFVAARLPHSTAPSIGQIAPTAEFVDVDGKPFLIPAAAESGPILLVFYRGHW